MTFASTVTNVGMVLNNLLSTIESFTAVYRLFFYQLRVVSRSLTTDVLQSLIQAVYYHLATRWDSYRVRRNNYRLFRAPQLSWCLGIKLIVTMRHATIARSSLVASWTASYLQNRCRRLEVYTRHCSSSPARAVHSDGQHRWSPASLVGTVCVLWLAVSKVPSVVIQRNFLLKMDRECECETVCQHHCETLACHSLHT